MWGMLGLLFLYMLRECRGMDFTVVRASRAQTHSLRICEGRSQRTLESLASGQVQEGRAWT